MVTLSILKYIEQNGFGTIDENLFWEKMGLHDVGLFIEDLGNTNNRGSRPSTTYQIFSRGKTDVDGYKQLQAVVEFLNVSFSVCKLPSVPPITDYGYDNVSFTPLTTISSEGVDMNGRVIYSATGQVFYGDKVLDDTNPPEASDYITTETGKAIETENNKIIQF